MQGKCKVAFLRTELRIYGKTIILLFRIASIHDIDIPPINISRQY